MIAQDLRANRRYELRLALHYRVSVKGAAPRAGSGTTCDISTSGLSFRCRRILPVGVHIEILIDWPAKHREIDPIALQVTGFIVRSDGNRTAVRMTSRKFKLVHPEPARATA
ncbi:MAG: PilZ domain-containing protein [Bryobacteraceae bacterium]